MSDYNAAHNGTRGEANGAEQVPGTEPVQTIRCPGCQGMIDTSASRAFSRVRCPACGAEQDVPAKFAHFLLLKRLGAGGMGTVFLAEDVSLGRKVAIKMMQKTLGEDPASLEIFRNEAQSAAKLNHPHVAQIYSFGQHHGCPYLEMELVPGNKLDGMISEGLKLDPAFVMRVGMEVAEGLKAAEGVGLFHGDIKPDNILFDNQMCSKLVDFGIASLASQGRSNELWGTPYYIAPEKVQKKKNSARSDIYSLGATLYHAIAGEPPYEGEDAVAVIKARFAGPPRPLEEIRPDIEPEVARIIGRMMYNDLFMRYPNYGSLINDIKNYLATVPAARKQGPMPAGSMTRRMPSPSATQNAGAASGGGEAPAGKPGKRFVIQKGMVEAQQAMRVSMPSAAHPVSAAAEPVKNATVEPERPPVNIAKLVVIVIVSVFGLSLVGGGIFLGNMIISKKKEAANVERDAARAAEIEKQYLALDAEMATHVSRMRKYDDEMTNELAKISMTYLRASGLDLVIPNLEPAPEPIPEPEPEPMPEAATPAAPEAAAPAEPAKAEPDPFEEEVELAARLQLEKEGVKDPSAEMLSIMKRKVRREKEAEAKAAAEAEATADDAEVAAGDGEAEEADGEAEAEAVEAQPEPVVETPAARLVKMLDEHIYTPARTIRAHLRTSERYLNAELQSFAALKPGMAAHLVSEALQTRQAAYDGRHKQIEEIEGFIKEAEEALRAIRRARIVFEREAAKLIAQREKLEQEAKLAAQQAREASKKAQAEAEAKAVANEQIARVREVFQSKKELIDKFEYEKAKQEMQRMEKELTVPEGLEELKWSIARLDALISLRAFLVRDLKAHPNELLQRAYRSYDVRGITEDETELIVPMRKNVYVKDLTRSDWIVLFTKMLESRPRDRKIGTMEQGEQLFNAAIFCAVHGEGNASAFARAQSLAKAALKLKTSLRHDADKLIPGILEGMESGEEENAAGDNSFGF